MRWSMLVLLFGAADLNQEAQPRLKPEWAVVLPADQAQVFWKPRLCNRPAPSPIESIWMPDQSTVLRLETALAPALQSAIDLSTIVTTSKPAAGDFYRQYAGFVVAGKRIVYINGLHKTTVERGAGRSVVWQTQAVSPCDGGMLFFGAEYDVETGQIRNVVFNGGGRGGGA